MGALCGYVGVPETHGAFEQNYEDLAVAVHGGLTYAGACVEDQTKVWWFGFDCAHAGDYVPMMERWRRQECFARHEGEQYRDVPYVQHQCAQLAAQLAKS